MNYAYADGFFSFGFVSFRGNHKHTHPHALSYDNVAHFWLFRLLDRNRNGDEDGDGVGDVASDSGFSYLFWASNNAPKEQHPLKALKNKFRLCLFSLCYLLYLVAILVFWNCDLFLSVLYKCFMRSSCWQHRWRWRWRRLWRRPLFWAATAKLGLDPGPEIPVVSGAG